MSEEFSIIYDTLNILVIDDDKGDRMVCQRALKSAFGDSLVFIEAEDGESGLAAIEEHIPDCVLLDHIMPGIDGIEVLKRIRIKYPYLPVVMINGKGNDVYAVQTMKEGAQDYITKVTITPPILQRVVQMAIEYCALKKRSEETKFLLATIIESSTDAIISKNTHSIITSWNEAAENLLGYSTAEAIGQNIHIIIPPDQDEKHIINDIKAGKAIKSFETVRLNKKGKRIDVAISMSPIRGASEKVVGASITIRDITERKEAEKTHEQLRQSQKIEALGQLTGGIAHDFNNLLAIVIGNLDFLSERMEAKDPLQQFVVPSIEAAERGAELTQSLLAFGRKQILQSKILSINDLIMNFTGLIRRTLGEKVELMFSLAPFVWPVNVDAALFENALLNLSINARDAIHNSGKLIYETKNIGLDAEYVSHNIDVIPGDYVMVAITDTGEGMSQETAEKAFEPFFTTKDIGKGSGLGLSMVYGFVKQSNGHIKIYSEVGHGTTIKIYLPRAEGKIVAADKKVEAAVMPIEKKLKIILVVEDNKELLKLTSAMVSSLGYNVLEAISGEAALEIIEARDDIDLLMTDVILGGKLNGPQLSKLALKIHPELKVLFNSGYAESVMLKGDFPEEGINMLSKPFRKSELAGKLIELLK